MARVPPVCWPNGLPQLPTSPLADLPAQGPNPIRLWWPAERLAVQRRGRRQIGPSMLHQGLCGVPVRCNGLLDGTVTTRAAQTMGLWAELPMLTGLDLRSLSKSHGMLRTRLRLDPNALGGHESSGA